MYIISDSENEKTPQKKTFPTLMISDDDDIMNSDDELSSSPMQDSYSSLKMIMDDKDSEVIIENIKSNKTKSNKVDSEERKKLNNFKLKKKKEKVKKEEIVKKIIEEAESKNASDVEEVDTKNENKNDSENLEKSENEKRLSDYIKQKFGNRKRKKSSNDYINKSEKKEDFISDFFDRGDKRKTKHYKPTSYLVKKASDKKEEDSESELELEEIKNHKMKFDKTIEDKDDFIEDIDELLSFEDGNMEGERIKNTTEKENTKNDSDYEDIKNSINDLIPSVIDEINKKLDTQKALLDENVIETPITNNRKKKATNKVYTNKDIIEDDEDDIDMSSLDIYKKIHLTFYGYKLLPNQRFGRIYPITLEVPETAKFRTVFKAYCAGTQLNEDDMLFNYNNIEIFSTSTLKGLDMTSSLENYRIDVFYRVEYPTYKHQLIVKQINDEEELQKEKEQKKMELSIQEELHNSSYINDDDNSNDRSINIIIQDKNKKEVKVLINMNDTIRQLGFMYLEKSSLSKSLISKLTFSFDGQKLKNNQTIKEIDIDNQDIIDVKISD